MLFVYYLQLWTECTVYVHICICGHNILFVFIMCICGHNMQLMYIVFICGHDILFVFIICICGHSVLFVLMCSWGHNVLSV